MIDRAENMRRLQELSKERVKDALKDNTDYVARAIWESLGQEEDYDAIPNNSLLKGAYRKAARAAIVAVFKKNDERAGVFPAPTRRKVSA